MTVATTKTPAAPTPWNARNTILPLRKFDSSLKESENAQLKYALRCSTGTREYDED